jgi:HEAT repeat protein
MRLLGILLLTTVTAFAAVDDAAVLALTRSRDVQGLKAMGQDVLPVMARLYESSTEDERAGIAELFYQIGWKSADAKRVLLKDVHTQHQGLRIQAQWALGRVSGDDDVVDILLGNMQNDPNPLFRDKAACALAEDQIHLSPHGKLRLYEGLIFALNDSKPQVRQIALQALQILTGQTKGFQSGGSAEERQKSVDLWKKWLNDYRSHM